MVDILINYADFMTYIWIVAPILVLVLMGVIYFIGRHNKRITTKDNTPDIIDNNSWINFLGGAANILEVEAKGSRLIVKLNNYDVVNSEGLHELGAISVLKSKEKVTIVVKGDAKIIANLLK